MPTIDRSGSSLYYTRAGSGPAVLLVQGVGVVGQGWQPQVEGLRDRFTVVAFDNRGIGRSGLGPAPVTIEGMAADALAVADAERLDRFHLVGHSMGGVIAQQLALSTPRRVKSLALLCTFPRGRDATRLTWAVLAAGIRTRVGTRAMRRRAFVDLVMPRATRGADDVNAMAARLATLFGRDLADQPAIVMQQLRATRRFDASPRFVELAALPTLVISARHDRISRPEYGRQLARSIPGARLIEVPDAGHGVTIQRAAVVNRALVDHFTSVELRAGSGVPEGAIEM